MTETWFTSLKEQGGVPQGGCPFGGGDFLRARESVPDRSTKLYTRGRVGFSCEFACPAGCAAMRG